jgi:hypothetical protein
MILPEKICSKNKDLVIDQFVRKNEENTKKIEVVKEFVHQGSLMTPTHDMSLEIQRRIQTTNFFEMRKHLRSSHLSRQTKFSIHKTLKRPVLL